MLQQKIEENRQFESMILKNYNLKTLNSFGVDVKTKYYYALQKIDDIKFLFNQKKQFLKKILVLGGGSNILFTKDYDGLIIHNQIKGIEKVEENKDFLTLKVGAGENWHKFVLYTLKIGLSGIENLSLIPGCVGAAPIQNIGAYGVEVKDFISKVEFYHIKERKIDKKNKIECNFGYRDSIFKKSLKNKVIITHVYFKLNKKFNKIISYGTLKELAQKKSTELKAEDISNFIIEIRNSKLPNPENIGNAGSFFKNPIVSSSKIEKLTKDYPEIIYFKIDNNNYKVSAGWLIENIGLKGYRKGDAGTYEKQALVIINHSNASGKELLLFSNFISEKVLNTYDIKLENEVNIY